MKNLAPLVLLTASGLLSCAPKPAPPAAPPPAPAPAPAPPPAHPATVDLVAALDTAANPCDDFYQYACGSWVKNTPLPADKPVWVRSFSTIQEQNLATLREVLEEAAKNPGTDANRQRLGAYYGSCMDEAGANARGFEALKPTLAEIDKVRDLAGFMAMSGKLSAMGVAGPVYAEIDGDFKDPTISILYLMQGGLSLPDREYYLKEDDASKALRAALVALVQRHLQHAGVEHSLAERVAPSVVDFETRLAKASVPRVELRDPEKLYNRVDRAGLLKHAPGLKLDAWLGGAGAGSVDAFSIGTPSSLAAFQEVLKKTDAATMRAYLKWQLVHRYSSTLDNETYLSDFAVFGTQLMGQKQPQDRWKRCVRATDVAMGEALGQAFVDKKFAGESKTIARAMINGIQRAFREGLPGLSWMDDGTRQRALEKATAITNKIGYPDSWRDYSALVVTPGKFTENLMAANRFESARQIAKAGKPVERAEWFMTPSMVNAYYNPTLNEMVFPAGILQPPFFSKDFPAAMNYGSIGMVMGHELTHGFDDQGRKFDGSGKMSEWWDPAVSARFETQTACVKEQYDAYTVTDGTHVNGALTLGENIADLGGTRLAYRAFKAQEANGAKANAPGLTEDQTFFVAVAQGWCTVAAPQYETMQVSSDPHSPARFRVNGPLTNLPEFHKAFNCSVGTKMHPEKTCEVW